MKKLINVFNYSIQNSSKQDEVDIYIDGEIVDASTQAMIEAFFGDTTSVSYKSFRNSLNAYADSKVFNVYLNCPGGHVGDALAMYDYLVDLQTNKGKIVNTRGRGIIASSGTLILLAGKEPEMSENSFFMMHEVSGGVYGTVRQVENHAVTMRKFNDKIRNLYVECSIMKKDEADSLMNKETWLTAQEAKDKGLISKVTGQASFKNKIEKEQWEYADTSILNIYNKSVKQEDMKNITDLFNGLKTDLINAIKGVKPAEDAKPADIVNLIADAMAKPFETLTGKLETELTNAIKTGNEAAITAAVKKENTEAITAEIKKINGEAITAAVKKENGEAITNAVKTALEPLEKRVEELEGEVENASGQPSTTAGKKEKVEEPIGTFN